MKIRILFVERKKSAAAVSIEKVFLQIAKSLSGEKFAAAFQQLQHPNDLFGTIKNLLTFKKNEADIYHVTGHVHYIALILPVNKTVLTVHDVGILRIRNGLRRYILKKLLFDLPIKRLKYITAVSEATKKEIIRHTNCPEGKIRVIENPLQGHFYAAEKKDFNSRQPTVLQIGTTANKNLANLIEALHGIKCRLVIVGGLEDRIVDLLKENSINYENKAELSDQAIRKEYEKADIITFCSTFEGFGLPIIEAQAMRKPVITSNLSPMKEVAGGGATLADPNDIESIRNSILQIINNPEQRDELILKGIENVKKYRSENIAAQYENLYFEVFKKSI